MYLPYCKLPICLICYVDHIIEDTKVHAEYWQEERYRGRISFFIIGEQLEEPIRSTDDWDVGYGNNDGHGQGHLVVSSSNIAPNCGSPNHKSGPEHKLVIVLFEGVEERWADEDIKDVEGVGKEKHHGAIGLEVLLGFLENGQVLGDNHEEDSGDEGD